MKRIISAVLTLCLVASLLFALSACSEYVAGNFKEQNLAKDAQVSINDSNGIKNGVVAVDFKEQKTFNTIVLKERKDRVKAFKMYYLGAEGYELFYEQDRIDKYRVCTFEQITTSAIRIEINDVKDDTKINEIEVYNVEKKEKDFIVSAYMTTNNQVVQEKSTAPDFTGYFNVITDLILIGEIGIDGDANMKYGEGKEDFMADVIALRRAAGEKKIKYRVTVNVKQNTHGETKDYINQKADNIAKTLREFCKEFDLEGIDFDWEYPQNGAQWKAYEKLVITTANVLKGDNKTVTVALPPWGVKFSKKTIESIEFVNLMSYDLFDERGDHASIYRSGALAVEQLRSAGVPKEKICLGLSFYGRTTNKSEFAWPDYNWDYANNGASLGKWGNYIANYEYKAKDGVSESSPAYLNGYAMNRDKTAYAIAADLAGVMIFRVKCDASYGYEYCLHKAVEEAIAQRIA